MTPQSQRKTQDEAPAGVAAIVSEGAVSCAHAVGRRAGSMAAAATARPAALGSLDRFLAQRRKSSILGSMFDGHSLGGFSPFRKRESSTAGARAREC